MRVLEVDDDVRRDLDLAENHLLADDDPGLFGKELLLHAFVVMKVHIVGINKKIIAVFLKVSHHDLNRSDRVDEDNDPLVPIKLQPVHQVLDFVAVELADLEFDLHVGWELFGLPLVNQESNVVREDRPSQFPGVVIVGCDKNREDVSSHLRKNLQEILLLEKLLIYA